MKKIILITGGQRSGKSNFAQKLAKEYSPLPVYLATSRIWDEEHRERVARHKKERETGWINIEEEKFLSKHALEGKTILIDCVTLWATNYFFDGAGNVDDTLTELKTEFNKFTTQEALFIFVTNEIGMGEMSQSAVQRRFADLQGWLNQYIAECADEVYFMVSGIPTKIK
ncbi:MAG: bifunctional adenosylcobinamide kinase/adenosylcobinamide-phosphate guanylyltransferase [Odoribacter sp.]|nr:bifunctional adenosylcobinamide kinase/adenosylcobinamide-phosphate guanylyltransferase [Odoribacter sp.]